MVFFFFFLFLQLSTLLPKVVYICSIFQPEHFFFFLYLLKQIKETAHIEANYEIFVLSLTHNIKFGTKNLNKEMK